MRSLASETRQDDRDPLVRIGFEIYRVCGRHGTHGQSGRAWGGSAWAVQSGVAGSGWGTGRWGWSGGMGGGEGRVVRQGEVRWGPGRVVGRERIRVG